MDRSTPVSGVLLLDKPSGPTSHAMVNAVRRGTGQRRVGHAGTLDPLATGLLVMCLGQATRLSEYLIGKDKRYTARVRFGQSTTTYDAAGEVTAQSEALPERARVETALGDFRGAVWQQPPAFSAIKRGGQKAYDLARRGEAVDLEPRRVEFYSIELVDWQPPDCTLEVWCSAGTYLRSLAHDLGQALGCGAHLAGLRRTASGSFRVSEAISLELLQAAFSRGDWQRLLRPADSALADWPEVHLPADAAARLQHGNPVPLAGPEPGADWGRAYNPAGQFIAIVQADRAARMWRPHKVFTD